MAGRVWCPWCEQVLAERAAQTLVEADCPRCRRRVEVAERWRDADGDWCLVERRWLVDWQRRQLAVQELRAALDAGRRVSAELADQVRGALVSADPGAVNDPPECWELDLDQLDPGEVATG